MPHPTIDQQVTFLYTEDLKRTSSFYENIIGLTLILDQGGCRIFKVCEDGFLGFCQREGTIAFQGGLVYTFVTEEVDHWFSYLSDRDVELLKEPEVNPDYNIYHFFFRDPNGYLLEVQKFLDPGWPSKGRARDDR
ncbi:MAG: VOC family protein [Anaerolineales bacterium]|jgi:catechol 2,3-dioxygenase-like lactoylglutathione lyase family enzyme